MCATGVVVVAGLTVCKRLWQFQPFFSRFALLPNARSRLIVAATHATTIPCCAPPKHNNNTTTARADSGL